MLLALDNKSLYNYVPGHFEHMTANIYTNCWNHQQCCKTTNMKMIFSPLFKCPVTMRTWNLSAYKRLRIALPTFELDNLNWVHGQKYEPSHDKTNKVSVFPSSKMTGGCPGWSESSLSAHTLCWFCHVAAHFTFTFAMVIFRDSFSKFRIFPY